MPYMDEIWHTLPELTSATSLRMRGLHVTGSRQGPVTIPFEDDKDPSCFHIAENF
jgi:hypothetical protein